MKQILLAFTLLLVGCYAESDLSDSTQAVEEDWEPDPNLFETQCAPAWYEYCWSATGDAWGQRYHRTCYHPLRGFWELIGACKTFGNYLPFEGEQAPK